MGIQAATSKFWIGSGIAIAMIVGAGTAYMLKSPDAIKDPIPVTTVAQITVTGYLIEARENKFVAVPISVKAKNNEEAIATALKNIITEKKENQNLYSAIPEGTQILSLTIANNDIRLNLSKEFTTGGGSASMRGRLIQLLYTSTSLNPDGNLFLSVEGKPLESLGGEGVEVSQPLRRQSFALEF
jgi:spore germination protein GerM